jgi:hypothetical protein
MRVDSFSKLLLAAIALFLGILVLRPIVQPQPAFAQADEGRRFYVEPGTTMLRKPDGTAQVYGKVFVDMRTGDVWGFPTNNTDPYPSDPTSSTPPKSRPIYLGRYELSEAVRK